MNVTISHNRIDTDFSFILIQNWNFFLFMSYVLLTILTHTLFLATWPLAVLFVTVVKYFVKPYLHVFSQLVFFYLFQLILIWELASSREK